jgi:hypothetical protein
MIFGKQEVAAEEVGSYLFEIFKLDPTFSKHFNISSDNTISMVGFIHSHYPKSIYLENLEQILFPYLSAKKALTKSKLQYQELIAELDQTKDIDNLKPEEKANLKATQTKLPNIAAKIKEDGQRLLEMEGEIDKKLITAKESCLSNIKEFKSKQIATIHSILDSLKIPREQFKNKEIDNPLNFISYSEAIDYINRQTTVNKDQIPIKNLEKAEHNYEIFQQLLLYLALIDCLLPLGIVYGK